MTRQDLLVRVAELYYQQGLNQKEIADIIEVSRPSVSRMLEEAKEIGIVEITIHSQIRKDAVLSNQLRTALGLRDAIVVAGEYDYDNGLRVCGKAAARFLGSILENNQTLGISWGPAPMYLWEYFAERDYYNVHVVQMVGCLGTGNPDADGLELAMRMANKVKGTYSNIYAPVFVTNKVVHTYLVEQTQIASTLKKARTADIIFTGIGSVIDPNSTLQRAGYLTDEMQESLQKQGCVGHLMARFFNNSGEELTAENLYAISAPLEAMREARWSVGIAASARKAPATLAAIRAGYINTLIADEALAKELLEMLS